MRMFGFFGPKAKYSTFSWWENFMGGHLNIGKRLTIYGDNAMCWAVNIRTKRWGVVCFTLPSIRRWKRNKLRPGAWPFYFYISPNGTPWAATYYLGGDKKEGIRAQIRKLNFGHNFDTCKNGDRLQALNNKFDSLMISSYDTLKSCNVSTN